MEIEQNCLSLLPSLLSPSTVTAAFTVFGFTAIAALSAAAAVLFITTAPTHPNFSTLPPPDKGSENFKKM